LSSGAFPSVRRGLFFAALFFVLGAGVAFGQRPQQVFVTDARVTQLQSLVAQAGSHHKAAYDAMKARVDGVPADFSSFPTYNLTGQPRDYGLTWFAREASLVYRITGDAAYAQRAYNALYKVYNEPDEFDSRTLVNDSGISRGMMGYGFVFAYNVAWDGLTEAQRTWIRGKITDGLNMWPSFSQTNLGSPYASNWNAVCRGSEMMMILGSGELDDRRARYETARDGFRSHLLTYSEHGWTQEGNGYISYGGEFLVPTLIAMRNAGDLSLVDETAENMSALLPMYAGAFTADQSCTQWGVGSPGFDQEGWLSALLGSTPDAETAHYRWFYDRYRGVLNPAADSAKFDQNRAGTTWALICYPDATPAADPTGILPKMLKDSEGGFWFRNRWQDADDTIVSLSADTTAYTKSWDEADAFQINILSGGTHFAGGPGKSRLASDFSTLLVGGVATNDTTHKGKLTESKVAPNGGYGIVSGDQKYVSLGLATSFRHMLVDFTGGSAPAVISTMDRVTSSSSKDLSWQLNTFSLPITTSTESGVPVFTVTSGDAYLKGWVLTPGATLTTDPRLRVNISGAAADIWVVMATGKGTPPTGTVTGSGLTASLALTGGTTLTFNSTTGRLESSTLTGLQSQPAAAFTFTPSAGLAPLAVTFNATTSTDPESDPLTYEWNFGDGTTATGATPSHTYSADGHYIATLTVNDGKGGRDQISKGVFIGNRTPTAALTATPTSGLPPLSVSFDASASTDPEGDALTYAWRFGDGTTATGATADKQYPEGTYTADVTVTDTAGNKSTKSVKITAVNKSPTVSFKYSPPGAVPGEAITFDGSASTDPEGYPLSYAWNFGDGTTQTTTNPTITHAYANPGIYDINLTVTDHLGLTKSLTKQDLEIFDPANHLDPVTAPAGLAPGLNYKYYENRSEALPDFDTLSPVKTGRVNNFIAHPRERDTGFHFRYTGFISVPADGVYNFRFKNSDGARLYINDRLVVDGDVWPYGDTTEDAIGLKAGLHKLTLDYNYLDAGQYSNDLAFLDTYWQIPGSSEYVRIPDSVLSAPISTLQASFMHSPGKGSGSLTVNFEATTIDPTGGTLSYYWDLGDGTTSTERKFSHTYTGNDDYVVKLTVTSSSGASDKAGTTVSLSDTILDAIDKTDEPGTITSRGQINDGAESRRSAYDNNFTNKWNDPASPTWSQYAFTANGGLHPYRITTYTITSANDFDIRDPYTWTLEGSNDEANWTTLDSRSAELFPQRHQRRFFTVSNPGHYAYYRVNITAKSGDMTQLAEIELFDDMSSSLAGNAAPQNVTLTAPVTSGPVPFTADLTLACDNAENDYLYYNWDFGDGQTIRYGTAGQLSHTYHTPGTYTVTCTVIDGHNARATQTMQITVGAPSAGNSPVASLATTGNLTGEPRLTVGFDASASTDPDGDAISYRWEFGDGNSATTATATHTYDQSGSYAAVLTVTDSRGRKDTKSTTITVSESAAAQYGAISFHFLSPTQLNGDIPWYLGAGAVPLGNWNNNYANTANRTGFLDHRGAESGIAVELPGTTQYEYPRDGTSGNHVMLRYAHGAKQGTARSYKIKDIPYSQYDLYVYHGGPGTDVPVVATKYQVGTEAYYAIDADGEFDGTLDESLATSAAAAVDGKEYVVFRGLTAGTVDLIVSGGSRTGPSGFQIVATGDGPVARPDSLTTPEDEMLVIHPLANDVGNNITVQSIGTPLHGTLTDLGDGSYRYTPATGFVGTETLAYTVVDNENRTANGTIQIVVGTPNLSPVANEDSLTVDQNGTGSLSPLNNDTDPEGDALSLSSIGTPAHGTAVIQTGNSILYTPTSGYYGSDSFTYTVADSEGNTSIGTVKVTVTAAGSTANQNIVSVAFSNNSGGYMLAGDVTGAVEAGNWNSLLGSTAQAGNATLKTDSGATLSGSNAVTIKTSANSASDLYSTVTPTTAIQRLFDRGFEVNGNVTLTIGFADFANSLFKDGFDLYLYSSSAANDLATEGTKFTVGSTALYTKGSQSAIPSSFIAGSTSMNATTAGANYVKFENLSGNQSITISKEVYRTNLNGLQIVPRTPPVIVNHPQSVAADTGEEVTFTVGATGPMLTYQWRKDGTNLANGGDISGATTNTLSIGSAGASHIGDYDCVVTNSFGTATSNPAELTLTSTPAASSLSVSPATGSVEPQGTLAFAATLLDQFGDPIVPQPAFTWSVDGGGTISEEGLFSAGSNQGGPFAVTVTGSGFTGTASVTVAAAKPPTGSSVFTAGGTGNEEFHDIVELSDGSVLVAGSAENLDWVSAAKTAWAADSIPNRSTGRTAFLMRVASDLQTVLGVWHLPPGYAENIRWIKTSSKPGEPTGTIFISGACDSTSGDYFIARLSSNFVNGAPESFTWVKLAKASNTYGDNLGLQPWDVGGDGRMACVDEVGGTIRVLFYDASGQPTKLSALRGSHWPAGVATDSTNRQEGIGADLTGTAVSGISFPTDLRSWTEADRLAILPDENGEIKRGTWPMDLFTAVQDRDGTTTGTIEYGYTGYRSVGKYRVAAIAINRDTNDFSIGFNVQSRFWDPNKSGGAGEQPDFEPAVIAYGADGALKWWSRLYHEVVDANDNNQIDSGETRLSSPDQYVDGLAIDYSGSNDRLVVLARCHGNNSSNFWNGNAVAANSGGSGFQNQFTGTEGNIHIGWVGKLRESTGTIERASYLSGYFRDTTLTQAVYSDPNLDGWPSHNAGWANLTTTRATPGSLRTDADGRVSVVGVGPRMVTTANAFQKLPKITPTLDEGISPWAAFARVYDSDLITLVYSSAVTGAWTYPTAGEQPVGADNTDLYGAFPIGGGMLTVGRKRDAGNPVPASNSPGWANGGSTGTDGLFAFLPFSDGAAPSTSPVFQQTPTVNPDPVTGTTADLSAIASDPDHVESLLTYAWTALTTPAGGAATFSASGSNAAKNTTATFTRAGAYSLKVVATDPDGRTGQTTVSVTVGATPSALSVSPATVSVNTGATTTFTATLNDQFGQPITGQAIEWSVSGGGTISSSGVFTAGATAGGPHTITATLDALTATAGVTVAEVLAPEVDLPATTAALTIQTGTNVSLPFTIRNTGNADLTWNATITGAGGGGGGNYTTFQTSAQTGGPVFSWHDISSNGTTIISGGSAVDDVSNKLTFPTGFTFPYYGNTFGNVWVCSNGFLNFGTTGTKGYTVYQFPNTNLTANTIGVFLTNWKVDSASLVMWKALDSDRIVISWENVLRWGTTDKRATFQVVLHRNGEILFQYKSNTVTTSDYSIGVQDSTKSTGLSVAYNQALIPTGSASNFAIRLTPASNVPLWLAASPASGTTAGGSESDLTLDFTATTLSAGTYNATLTLASNDADESSLTVPVTLTVTDYEVFSSWIAGQSGLASLTAATDDPDADGLANLLEFALGTEPGNAASGSAPTAGVDADGRLTLTFTPERVSGLRYVIEASSDLSDWSDTTDITSQLTAGQAHTHTDSVATPTRRFLRLRISLP
jgi:PKD repeat protein